MTGAADTIFALSSGRPPAAIAVVRVSGPRAGDALLKLTGRLPQPRRAVLATVRDPESGEAIDQALALWFPGPKSETGEDVAELQLHGGRSVVAATLEALGRLPGFRPAEAGEFTRRAFANGHLDLTEVEGLADLIGAETEAQRRQAMRQLQGVLGTRAEAWRARLIELQAQIEASLDFSDEGDVPDDLVASVKRGAAALESEVRAVLADDRRGERLRDGLVIAIAGPPNAGKSTLFNWLAGREAAIVSPHPGTTRDVLEVHLEVGGYPVTVLDTAGMRASDDPVEREGIARAVARAGQADLLLWITDAACVDGPVDAGEVVNIGDAPVWMVLNKVDLLEPLTAVEERKTENCNVNQKFKTSARTEAGLAELLAALAGFARNSLGAGEGVLITRTRHRHALEQCAAALNRIMIHDSQFEDLVAEDLRSAGVALGRLTGRIDVEDVLESVFRDFCIGK